MPPVGAVFLRAWNERGAASEPLARPLDSASRLDGRLAELEAAARSEWAGIDLPPEDFARALGERARPFDDPESALTRLRTSAVYLACACARGDERALSAFDRSIVPKVRAALARSFDASVVDDAVARMMERLFVGSERSGPSIGSYAGRGDLARWAQVAAEREALRILQGARHEQPSDDDALFEGLLEGSDDELARLKHAYRASFRAALEAAFGRLGARERAVLRYHYVDGLNIDEIGKLYDVHRATVARWREQARVSLFEATREALAGASDGSVDLRSILTLIQSQLDFSVRRLLELGPDEAG
jgi:RNA polymerase sigma-70 factor (ECF subfamily)